MLWKCENDKKRSGYLTFYHKKREKQKIISTFVSY